MEIIDFLKLRRSTSDPDLTRRIDEVIFGVENSFYRDLLIRHYIEGQSCREIADELFFSLRHVKRLLSRARHAADCVYNDFYK